MNGVGGFWDCIWKYRRHMAAVLTICMVTVLCADVPGIRMTTSAAATGGTDPVVMVTAFEMLAENVAFQEVEAGTSESELVLPSALSATGYEVKPEKASPANGTASGADWEDAEDGGDEDLLNTEPHAITIPDVSWEADPLYDGNVGGGGICIYGSASRRI